MVVTVSGSDLYQTLKENLSHLALATAQGLQFSQLTALPGMKLMVPEQSVSDCESLVQQNTSYTQYLSITMKGGLVDERHKPVHTSPIFISCGLAPFLQYHDRSPQYSTNPVALVQNMASTVKSGFYRLWGGKEGEEEPGSYVQVSVILLLYLPRRGLIEVWSPEQKNKVTEFHVSKHGLLLRSTLACLDDGILRRREVLTLYCAFLQPSGSINQFYIPFHALTTSSSAERDFQLQAGLRDLLLSTPVDLDKLVGQLGEVRNPQLRSHIITDIITGENRLG